MFLQGDNTIRPKKPLIYMLTILLTLQCLAVPVFPVSLNEKDSEATKIQLPEPEVTAVNPVFQRGLSYSAWSSDAFSSPESDESLERLTETNTEWIAICFSWFQSSTTSHDIHLDPVSSPTTESVKHAIVTAHSLGLKVMLKPMVEANERQEASSYPIWRGEILPSDEWFESYSSFINFFAEFAQQNDVELFCVGCEYKETTGWAEQWREVILGVRERYFGPITYAADWTNYQNIEFWDSLDYVGIDAYFPLALFSSNPTLEELKTVWTSRADEIEEWHFTVNRPVIFTEIGYRSGDGTAMAPANYWADMAVDLQEQRDCYEAAFQTLWSRSWFYGFYWWTWIHDPAKGGLNDSNHTPQNKPAQEVITSWYSLERRVAVVDQTFTSSQKCGVNQVQFVGFHFRWEDDGTDIADAGVTVNGTEYATNKTGWISFSTSYNTVGKRSWAVTDFEHPEASGYKVSAERPSIVWDKVVVNVEVDSNSFGAAKVRVKVTSAYDGSPVTGAAAVVNEKLCEETEIGVYETEIASWSPFQQLTLEIDVAGFAQETLSSSTIHTMNVLLYFMLVVAVIVLVVLFLKRRNRGATQPVEGTN